MDNSQFFNTYRHNTANLSNIVFNNTNTNHKPIIKNNTQINYNDIHNDKDNSGLDISKTLKYEKKKIRTTRTYA